GTVLHTVRPLDVGIRPTGYRNAELRILRRSDLAVLGNVVAVWIFPGSDVGGFEHRVVELREPDSGKGLHILAHTRPQRRFGIPENVIRYAEARSNVIPVGQIRYRRKCP